MSDANFWGNLIRDLRSEQKISQRQLAARAKVNRSTLRRIEEGTASGDVAIMERLFGYLGYELEAVTVLSKVELHRRRMFETSDPVQRSRASANRLLSMSPELSP